MEIAFSPRLMVSWVSPKLHFMVSSLQGNRTVLLLQSNEEGKEQSALQDTSSKGVFFKMFIL